MKDYDFNRKEILDNWKGFVKYFKLSELESKVFHTLMLEKSLGLREIIKKSEIPKTKIYNIINNLKNRGLVIELPLLPKQYKISQDIPKHWKNTH